MNPQDYKLINFSEVVVEVVTVKEFFVRDEKAFEKYYKLDSLLVDIFLRTFLWKI